MQARKLGPEGAGQRLRSMGRPMEGVFFSLSPLGWELDSSAGWAHGCQINPGG